MSLPLVWGIVVLKCHFTDSLVAWASSAMAQILVIDDDHAVRGAMQLVLQAEGFDVVVASDGRNGIVTAQANAPDLVIVDLFMPGMTGIDTIRAIRERIPRVPIIAISGALVSSDVSPADARSPAALTGADITLHKPFRPNELLKAVRHSIGDSAALATPQARA
jgi:CheY-like chemotaxis protein